MAHLRHCSVSSSPGWSAGLSPAGQCPALQMEEQGLGIHGKAHRDGQAWEICSLL